MLKFYLLGYTNKINTSSVVEFDAKAVELESESFKNLEAHLQPYEFLNVRNHKPGLEVPKISSHGI